MKQFFKILFLLLFFGGITTQSEAQHFDFGVEYGYSGYFGDLAPYSAIPSFTTNSNSTGYYAGYGIKYGTVFVNYTSTILQAFDREADKEFRRTRNLNFRTPVLEWGLTGEINLASFFLNRYTKLQPIIIGGANVFYFTPQAYYEGQWVELQPLGTEGQGIPGYNKEKYSLTQISIPLGGGIKYQVTDMIWIGVGIKARLTFTDYLDDVSGAYVDQEVLAQNNGALAAELAFRSDELDPSYIYPDEGQLRGNPNENDWYMTSYLTMGLRFNRDESRRNRSKIRCPKMY